MPKPDVQRAGIELARMLDQQESLFVQDLLRADVFASATIVRDGWDAAHEAIGEYLARRERLDFREALAIDAWQTAPSVTIDRIADELPAWMDRKRSDFKRWARHRLDLQECLLLYDAIAHNASMARAIEGAMLVSATCWGPSSDTRTYIHRSGGPKLAG